MATPVPRHHGDPAAASSHADPAPTSRSRIAAAFLGASAIWGSTFLVIRLGNATVPPLWGAALRLAFAGGLLVVIARVLRQPWPRGAQRTATLWYGLFQFGFNFPLLYWGETQVPSGLAAVLYATTPLSGALFAVLFGLERFRPVTLLGAVVALGGVSLIFRGAFAGHVSIVHTLAVFCAATLAAFGTVLFKRGGQHPAIPANALACLTGLPVCVLASLVAREPQALPSGFAGWGPILYLAIAGSIGAFTLFSWLVQRWDVSRAAFIGVVVPVIAMILGVIAVGERFTLEMLLGSGLVLLGLALGMGLIPLGARPAPH